MSPQVAVLGIRHHGPGSARSVAAALDELEPNAVVIEGAPELDGIVDLAASPDLVPPVSGLVYVVDEPRRATFYPLAVFSPEWVAMRWALARGVPVRFADLPAANVLAADRGLDTAAVPAPPDPAAEAQGSDGGEVGAESGAVDADLIGDDEGDLVEGDAGTHPPAPWAPAPDTISTLARIAGYDDAERWWEDAIEHRGPASSLERFALLGQAIAEVRAAEDDHERATGTSGRPWRVENDRREAAMRRVLRDVRSGGHERIAVVCGAYHAPALDPASLPPAAHDTRLLKGLAKVKVAATWAPWTAGRLASSSGYGAGVTAPGWYEHLFTTPSGDDPTSSWLVRVAGALRAEQVDASPAAVVEATRLAGTLATVRGRPSVGLAELEDATRAVLCEGSSLPLQLITDVLVIGHGLGSVPESTPMVPLAADLARQQKTLRLKPSAAATVVAVDLRRPGQLARSVLFHRLNLLGIDWAVPVDAGRTSGTFKEGWQLEWRPELAVALIEASVHGTTVEAAATDKAVIEARAATDLTTVARLVEACLLAELADGVTALVSLLAERTAHQHDTVALLDTIEPLARTCRYGDVRGTDVAAIESLLETVVVRAAVGLRAACTALDDDSASTMREAIEAAHRGVTLLDTAALREPWTAALASIAERDDVHGAVSGRSNRLLLDGGTIATDEAGRRMSRRLSRAADAPAAAAWLDGFLAGDVVLLLHDPELLATVDGWVATIDDATFEDLLPLLRRTFARFERPERRQLGEHLRRSGRASAPVAVAGEDGPDLDRAAAAMAKVASLLGLVAPGPGSAASA